MLDMIMVLLVLAAFVLAGGYARLCDRLLAAPDTFDNDPLT
jgi:hypothetical protein